MRGWQKVLPRSEEKLLLQLRLTARIRIQIHDYGSLFRTPRQLICLRTELTLLFNVHLQKAKQILQRSITKGTDLTVLPWWPNVPPIIPRALLLISVGIFHVQT